MRPQPKINVAFSATNASTLALSTDCRGYNYATFIASTNTTGGIHATAANTILEESDDNTSFTTVTTGVTFSTVTAATTLAKCVWNVDLRGRKRYIRPTIGLAATATIQQTHLLYNSSKDAPFTATLANSVNIANI